MSALTPIDNLTALVRQVEPKFNELAKAHGAVTFAIEANFALQILKENNYLAQVASGNPDSLKSAIENVASVGLSLNPVHKLAYLVPRKGKMCLDIAYKGLIHLAVDAGAIKWAVAEIVHEKDTYESQGVGKEPVHRRQPFASDRGKIVGAYCVAPTREGDFRVTEMSAEEIYSIRNRSESWKAYEKDPAKKCPWVTDESEMIKKTVIRRAYKSWPLVDTSRFEKAMEVTSEADPVQLGAEPAPKTEETQKALVSIRSHLQAMGKTEENYVTFLARQNKRAIKGLDELTPQELSKADIYLSSVVKAHAQGNREKAG